MSLEPPEAASYGRLDKAVRRTFLSLRNRNFRLFFWGQLVSNTGNWLTNIAITLLVLKLTGSGLAVGFLAACQYGPIFFLSAWAGAIADRSDKRKFLLLTQSLEMMQSIGLAILAFQPHPPIAGVYVLAVCGGILLAFDNPLRRSFVSEMVQPDDLPNAVVLYSTIVNVSRMFGPALAGLLVVTLGFGWCFTIDAASYLVVLACLVAMRPAELYRSAPKQRGKREVREGLQYVLKTPELWISFAMLAAIGTLSYNFSVTLPIFVTDALRSNATTYTLLYSIFSLGAVISALFVAHRNVVTLRHVLIGALALGLSMLLLAASPSVGFAMLAVFIVGLTSIMYTTSTTTIAQLRARHEMRGRVLSLQTVLLVGPTAIGGPLLGGLADWLGGRAPLILGGLVSIVAAAWGFTRHRAMDARNPNTSIAAGPQHC